MYFVGIENVLFPDSLLKILRLFTCAVSCSVILIFAYKYLTNVKKLNVSTVPGLKFPFYKVLGILTYLPSYRTRKKLGLGTTAFTQQMLSGGAMLFPEESVLVFKVGLQNVYALTKAESVEEFLCLNVRATKPFKKFLLPLFGDGPFLSGGQKWKFGRKLITPIFHYDILKEFVSVFDTESKVMVDILRRKSHKPWIDVFHPVALCTMDIICKSFLGIDVDAQKEGSARHVTVIKRVTKTIVERMANPLYYITFIFALSRLGRQFAEDITYLREFALKAVQQRKEERKQMKEGQKDKLYNAVFMDLLLDSEENYSHITENYIRDDIISFIFAGEDTMCSGLAWTLYLIGLYPEIQKKIHEELDNVFGADDDRAITAEDLKQMCYVECVIKESQRLYPTIPYNPKYTLEDCTLCGYKIKKGSIVVINAYDLHRNPEVFPNPEVFDPERFLPENCADRHPFAYVPFSGGARSCIGRRFAMMEAKTVVANVLHKFSLKSLEPRDKIHTSFEITLRSPHPLKIKFIPRHITDAKK